jgi:glycosyltransferase involved in cell wall biosynthesis
MKVAVVHDYFVQLGGAERVAEELCCIFPEADLLTTVALRDKLPSSLGDRKILTTWMQNMPGLRYLYRLYFLLYPFSVGSLNLSAYELVLTSSSGYAKGIKTSPNTTHVCYCHTPMRWVWDYERYSSRETFSTLQRLLLRGLVGGLKHWDKAAAKRPDFYIANSHVVAERIMRSYGRTAEVIYPPIETERFAVAEECDDFYLVLSRLVAYKRIDLAVRSCTKLGKMLYVIGTGPYSEELKAFAGPTIKFLGRLSDEEVNWYTSRCRALIFPGEEDFGMAPLETAAAGRPTIAYRAGGALESVVEGVTGVFFNEQTPESLEDAILAFEQLEWDPAVLREHAETYSTSVFRERLLAFLDHLPPRSRSSHGPDQNPAAVLAVPAQRHDDWLLPERCVTPVPYGTSPSVEASPRL